jgi:potassium efflux system protein
MMTFPRASLGCGVIMLAALAFSAPSLGQAQLTPPIATVPPAKKVGQPAAPAPTPQPAVRPAADAAPAQQPPAQAQAQQPQAPVPAPAAPPAPQAPVQAPAAGQPPAEPQTAPQAAPPAGAAPQGQAAPAPQQPGAPAAAPGTQPAQPGQPADAAPTQPESADPATAADRAVERMKARIQELEARTDIAPAIRDQALTLLRNAQGQLEAASSNAASAKRFQEAAQRSPERVAEAKQQLEALQKEPGLDEFKAQVAPLQQIEAQQALDAANGEAATMKTDLDQLEARLRDMSTRATSAREEQLAEKQALDALDSPEAAAAISDPDPIVADARRAAQSAERRARTARLNLLEQELISLPARQASATARRDLAAAKLDRLLKRIPILEARVAELKDLQSAAREAEAAREARQLSAQHPVLEAYVKDTEVIRRREEDAARRIAENKARLAEVQADIARLKDSKVAAQQVLEIGSIGGEFSELLRAMRAQLPVTSQLERSIFDRDQMLVDARLKRLQADEARRALSDSRNMAERVLASAVKPDGPKPSDEVLGALEKLVVARRDIYVQLHDSLVTRIGQLAELNAAERDLLNQTTQLRALLNSRLLWLPSAEPISMRWFGQVRTSFSWIADTGAWNEAGRTLLDRAGQKPFLTGFVLLIVGVLTLATRRLRARLSTISEAVGRYSTDNYWRTPEALFIAGLLALKTPIAFGYAGWLLTEPPLGSDFTVGVGNGLLSVASIVTFLRFLQFITIENGLFSVHFGWSERARALLFRNILWLKFAIIPVAFILGMIEVNSAQSLRDGLGRFVFLAGGIAFSLFLARVLSPRNGILAERLQPGHPLWTTRILWYPLAILLPLAIAGLALWGYYDGASQIQRGLILSFAIIVAAFLAYSVVMRFVLVTRKRLEIRRAHERREKARAAAFAAAQTASQEGGDAPPLPVVDEEEEVDIASISEQTRNLVRLAAILLLSAALYFFWREALPSLALLDVPLWQQTITVDGATRTMPITVSNVMVALAILVITFIASRNLPGLLEIAALHRLRLEAGTRYAVSAICRYLIAILGLAFAFRSIGFDWSQVQWIVAALGVGVGFGLQEIVANFISGLIILFERPVRVGDTVTIGNLTGTVSRIHIRATSMTDGENREIIIPNKSLITEKVINWTLNDSITRVTLKVSVRYGVDTLKAQQIIMEAAKATPHVLDNPAPSVFFAGFGASALEFEVRASVLQLAQRSSVINDLNVSIERALREQEIAVS